MFLLAKEPKVGKGPSVRFTWQWYETYQRKLPQRPTNGRYLVPPDQITLGEHAATLQG
jgi:hypothetical protein